MTIDTNHQTTDHRIESPTKLDIALAYAARWEIFPANIWGKNKKSFKSKKYSDGRNWGKTKDPEEIKQDFRNHPRTGIGIATGAGSGIFVVEADTKKGHDVDGIAALRALEAKHGPLPETLKAESPSGSIHYYFNYPKDGAIKNSASEIAPGVDVRGDGGMVIAPPSVRGDGAYRWINEGTPIADAPPWLIELTKKSDRAAPTTAPTAVNGEPVPDYLLGIDLEGLGLSTDPADNYSSEADIEKVAIAMAAIPNPDEGWEEWNRKGMAIWRATEGSEDGRQIFHDWSKKSKKYVERTTDEKWKQFSLSPPTQIGAGSIFRWADETDSNWWKGVIPAPATVVEEEPTSDPGTGESKGKYKIIKTSGDFVKDFVPPDYLIDGILLRRFLYSMTALTGAGKTSLTLLIAMHVALGLPIEGIEVEKGKVLYMAGENADDVRIRWVKLCEVMEVSPEDVDVFFIDGVKQLSSKIVRGHIDNDAFDAGPFALVIVDTSFAFFEGNDDNDNVEAKKHAQLLRTYIGLEGGPTVLVNCHPVKNPNLDNLIPRGGGAFLNEVDGNLTCRKNEANMTVELHWAGKIRGPDFAPIPFKLNVETTEKLKDQKGRPMWTVYAEPISAEEMAEFDDAAERKINMVLSFLNDKPNVSMLDIAEHFDWRYKTGKPNKSLVQRILNKLKTEKLVEKQGTYWIVTKKGEKAVEREKGAF